MPKSRGLVDRVGQDGGMARAALGKRPTDVARMFDAVADRYARMNALMTFGQERRWRRQVAATLGVAPGMRVLDLAAGTGASSLPFAAGRGPPTPPASSP